MSRSVVSRIVLCVGLFLLAACQEPLDTTRVVPERMTLGAEIFKILCQRVASDELPWDVMGFATKDMCEGKTAASVDTPERLATLVRERDRLVIALDAAMPENMHDDLSDFLIDIVPLYDLPDETLPHQTRAAADLLRRLMDDSVALGALERIAQRRGTREQRYSLGIMRPALGYHNFDALTEKFLSAIDEGGSAAEPWNRLLRALSVTMATTELSGDPPGHKTSRELIRDLMLTQDADFARSSPAYVVRRDSRGLPIPTRDDGGRFIAPFADINADGLADANGIGRFTDFEGIEIDVPTPFPVHNEPVTRRDPVGRAQRSDGTLMYEYIDTSRTLLAGLLGELAPMLSLDNRNGLELAWAARPLLGSRVDGSETFGETTLEFPAFNANDAVITDFVHATATVMHRPEVARALTVTHTLMNEHEDALAGVIDSMWYGDARADQFHDAALEQPNDLWDDVIHVGTLISEQPGLMQGLLRAFSDPDARYLGWITAQMMRHTDQVTYDVTNINAPPRPIGDFVYQTDWNVPEGNNNESIFQRSIALIHDLDGVRLCNKAGAKMVIRAGNVTLLSWPLSFMGDYGECELFEIPNAAEFYADAILGEAELVLKDAPLKPLNTLLNALAGLGLSPDDVLEQQSGINGMTRHPTPEAVARMVFGPDNLFLSGLINPVRTRDGDLVRDRYPSTAQAWEKKFFVGGRNLSFIDVLKPVLRALKRYDEPGGRFMFAEIIGAFHMHWASRRSVRTQRADASLPHFSYQDNGRSYEPLVAEIFAEGGLIERLADLTGRLSTINVDGADGVTVMADVAELMLLHDRVCPGMCAQGQGPHYLNGRDTICTNTGVCYDGLSGRERRKLPAIYLILDALQRMDDVWADNPERKAKWDAATSQLVHQLFDISRSGGTPHMANRRGHAVSRTLVPFLRDRIQDHVARGDGRTWAADLEQDTRDMLNAALFSATLDLMEALHGDAPAQDELVALLDYMLDPASSNDALMSITAHVGDMVQALPDESASVPLIRALAAGVAPNARDAVDNGDELRTDGSPLDETLNVVRAMRAKDESHALPRLLYNLVQPIGAAQETPIDVLVDVIAEVNRVDPGAGTPMMYDDFESVFESVHHFLTSEERGFERLYNVVQSRELQQ